MPKGPVSPFPVTDENRLRVTSPRDLSAGGRYLAFGAAELRHGEDAVSVPDEGDAVSVGGPGRAGLRIPELWSIAEALHSRRLSRRCPSGQARHRPTTRRRRGCRPGTTQAAPPHQGTRPEGAAGLERSPALGSARQHKRGGESRSDDRQSADGNRRASEVPRTCAASAAAPAEQPGGAVWVGEAAFASKTGT